MRKSISRIANAALHQFQQKRSLNLCATKVLEAANSDSDPPGNRSDADSSVSHPSAGLLELTITMMNHLSSGTALRFWRKLVSFVPARLECTIWGHQPSICGICYNVQDHLWVLKFNQSSWPGSLISQPRQPWLEALFICGGKFVWCNMRFGQKSGRYVDYAFLCVNFLCRLHAFGRHISAQSWWLEAKNILSDRGPLVKNFLLTNKCTSVRKK